MGNISQIDSSVFPNIGVCFGGVSQGLYIVNHVPVDISIMKECIHFSGCCGYVLNLCVSGYP